MIVRSALLAVLLLSAVPASAKGLTVRMGETWIFALREGQPVRARKVAAATKPGRNEVQVSVRPMMGTSLSITGRLPTAYTYRAEIVRGGKVIAGRACALPANGKPVLEYWKETVDAVRLSDFRPATGAGSCPQER